MTEKIFGLDMQLFALPDTPTVSASESNVVVEGTSTETGETSTVTETDAAVIEALEAFYEPEEGDTQEIDGITYTYNDGNWTYETDTTAAATAEIAEALFDLYDPEEGDTQTYEGVTYTYTNGEWTYPSETTLILTDTDTLTTLAEIYLPAEGETVDYDGVTYTYTDGNWTYTDTETLTADEEHAAAAYAAYLESVLSVGDTQDYDGVTYTYNGEKWTYETEVTTTTTVTDAELIDAITAAASTVDSETTLDGITYTYIDGNWTYKTEVSTTATVTDTALVDAIAAAATTVDSETTLDGITYTYIGGNWTYDTEVTTTTTVTDAELIDTITEAATTVESEVTVNGTTYTKDGDFWTYITTEEQTAASDSAIAAAAVEAYLTKNLTDGPSVDFDNETYTYDGANWLDSASEVVTDTATIAGILAALITDGASVDVDGVTYTYDAATESWSYLENVTETETDVSVIADIVAAATTVDTETTLNGITYTYTNGNWTYATTTTVTEIVTDAARIADIVDAATTVADEVTYDGTKYIYSNGKWTYDTTTTVTETVTDAARIADIVDAATTVADKVTYDGTEYTQVDGEWTYDTTITTPVAADDGIVTAILSAYYIPSDGATADVDGKTYTYQAADYNWTYEDEVTKTATNEVAAAIIKDYLPADGATQEVDGVTYTYDADNGEWSYVSTESVAADEAVASAILAAYYMPSDGDTRELDGVTYTYNADNGVWYYGDKVTENADSDTAAAIVAEYYTADKGDTQEVDGVTYTYDGENWTHEQTATVTAYYQFSDSDSSTDSPVTIQEAVTDGDTENTSLASPAFIGGTGEDFVLKGVGTVSGLEDGEYVIVSAESDTAALIGLHGDIALTAESKHVTLNLNDANLDYSTADKGGTVSLGAVTAGVVIAQAEGAVTLNSIDDKQHWILNDSSDTALSYDRAAYFADGDVYLSAADSASSVLSAALDEGTLLFASKDSSAGSDLIAVNGVTIQGAAKANSTIEGADDGVELTVAEDGATISVNSDSVVLNSAATATIEGSGSDAAIVAVDSLDANGKWVANANEVSYAGKTWAHSASGAVTLTADSSDGSSIAKANFSSGTLVVNAEDTSTSLTAGDINVNGKATWDIAGYDDNFDDFAVFDTDGNVTLTSDDRYSGSATLDSGKNVTFTSGTTGDVLTVSKGAQVSVVEDEVIHATSLAAGGSWTAKAGAVGVGAQFIEFGGAADSDGTRAIITADKSNGNVISSIQGLSDNITLSTVADRATVNGLTVGDATWTIKNAAVEEFTIPGTSSPVNGGVSELFFDATGNVTVSADSDSTLEVLGTSSADSGAAVVNVSNSDATIKVNGIDVAYDGNNENGVTFTLEEKAHNAGIAAISGVSEGYITVNGDNSFKLNDYTYSNSARADARFLFYEDSPVVNVQEVQNGDNIVITGGSAALTFADTEKTTAAVTVNGAGVTLAAADADDIDDVMVFTNGDDKVTGFYDVAVATTINTSSDDKFVVTYEMPDYDTAVTLNVNNTTVEIGEDATYTGDPLALSVNGSNVTLTGVSFGTGDTLTVSGGNYKIGKSAAVAVTETLGYITFDQHGNASAVEKSVKENEDAREGVIDSVEAAALAASQPVFALYQKLGTENSGAPSSTVAGYENASDSTSASSSVEGGINIYGDAALNSDDLTAVTLQSFTNDNIVIFEDSDTSIRTSVIDVSKGSPSVVAIDPLTGTTGVNHTVLGGNNANYIKFGANARGNNYAQAGSVGSYLANEGGTATLIGGAGNDSIAAKKGDKVTGGAGADYFFDANGAYAISDYSAAQGDVLVASKLADINKNLDAQTLVDKITVKDNTINIAGGGKFTLNSADTSSDATVSALNVRFTDSSAQDIHKLTWAAADGGNVNTNAFSEGAVLMVADQNDGASDSVVGSSGNDTIFVGGNDTVNAGSGSDEIYITAANDSKKEEGAVVQLGGGRTYIHNFEFGFDNASGNNILNTDARALTFDNKEDTLIAHNSNDTIYFVDNDSATEVFDLLLGTPDDSTKLSYLRSSKNVQITSNDDIADMYYTAADVNATLTFTDGVNDIADTISLNGGNYENIHNVVLNNSGAATLVGTGDKDVLVLGGTASADSRKHVSLGGGNDSIVSGGTSTSVAGSTIYFGLENDGSDIVDNFGYYQGSASDADKVAADKIIVYNWQEGTSAITANGNNIEIKVDGNSKLTLHEDAGINANNKILYQLGYDGEERIMQVGQTSGAKNNFTYDKETFVYVGNQEGAADTLSIAATEDNVAVWLDGHHGKVYEGIGVIDASAATNAQLTLAGGAGDNTITAGGEGNSSSLWGGGYGNNELIAGAGTDMFFFTKCGSNDTITGFDAANDRIRLGDITLDDLVQGQAYFNGDDVQIQLKAESGGGTLTIKNANGAQVEVNKGDGSYQVYTASTTNQTWS